MYCSDLSERSFSRWKYFRNCRGVGVLCSCFLDVIVCIWFSLTCGLACG